MNKPIRRVGVLGAGVMGSGIAAHLANAGVQVVLLDMVPPDLSEGEKGDRAARNRFSAGGLEKALKAKPAAFFHKSNAALVEVGNFDDDLGKLSTCDLVIEAVAERLDIKRSLFEKVEAVIRPGTIVASNTSGLRIRDMLAGRGEAFRKHFLVMHFFNPVRYMKLLELVAGEDTDPAVFERVRCFGEDRLGKGIVVGKDTPNFIGNRIGIHAMLATIHQMLADHLSPEDVDAITGVAMAHPKSASFRTADIVGLDTFIHVADNCYNALSDDEEREVFQVPSFIRTMAERKLLGDKTKAGFYRKPQGGDPDTFDPYTLDYRPKGGNPEILKTAKAIAKISDPKERVRKLVADQGPVGQFAWKVLSRGLAYAARRVGEISDSVVAIDQAMKWGYNWELGPFEVWDALGFVETAKRMIAEGIKLPESIARMVEQGAPGFYREEGAVYDLKTGDYQKRPADPRYTTFEVLRRGQAPVLKNDGAEAWDLGDGVLGLTFKTKANSIDPDVIAMLPQAVEKAEQEYESLVIYNQGEFFCVGANLFLVVMAANNKDWESIRAMVKGYQDATQRLKYATVPVVAAPYNMTLGGGLELCFACSAVQAAAETYAGLVEVGVGLIPGGAGTLNMLWRALENIPEGTTINTYDVVTNVFKNIALAKVATSAVEAKHFGYFRRSDGVSFDRARQLYEAKQLALGLARSGYNPPIPRAYKLPGESGIATLSMMVDTLVAGGYASEHDALIARKLAVVLCGGAGGASREVTEEEILELEREAFVSLCGEPKSIERMMYMLQNNKPLRN
ncbi:MAG: 3-hydroxyacyl-CoA dehydrogenase/enoyl-CoA hydratase family protein [Myxococcales bacterium]|nr:3-hydroxyacyl-CoA dehydrogenase/enoyl-CoA hydratase family protein [Polyangiaceae bacterium]MDW8248268.1 3-hydroxyacyl-CoA dehydrogenase/enoyl-CoA hydratase family protein [Myxococcales bacterium]